MITPGYLLKTAALIGVAALALSVGTVIASHAGDELWADGADYTQIAHSLASGLGYTRPFGLYPGQPTVKRTPLWPALLAAPFWLFPHQDAVLLARLTAALMNGLAACGAALLTGILGGTRRRMALAGVVVALWPETHPYMTGAACEPCASAVLMAGTALLCLGERYFFGGVLILSLLPLVRPDFTEIPVLMAVVYLVLWLRSRKLATRPAIPIAGGWRARIALAMLLFYIPVGAWMVRNYRVTGAFPVLAGVEGVTFYGSYNQVTISSGPNLGGWIPPDNIPGQEKQAQLSKRMSEVQIIKYYRAKAWQFIEGHWRMMPMLMTLHAIHPFLPDPLEGPNRYIFWLCRLAMAAGFLLLMWLKPPDPKVWYGLYGLMLTATALATVAPAVAYNGLPRHFYTLMILAIPLFCSAGCAPERRAGATVEESGNLTVPATIALH